MKRIISVAILVFIAMTNVIAQEFTYTNCGQELRYKIISEDAKTCSVSSKQEKCKSGLVIPIFAYRNGISYDVVEIEDDAFSMMTELSSVSLPSTLKKIGSRAFYGCKKIAIIYVPEGVETIGKDAFYGINRVKYDGKASGKPWGAEEVVGNNNSISRGSAVIGTIPQNQKRGMLFLRTELSTIPSVAIGYGGEFQVFLTMGVGPIYSYLIYKYFAHMSLGGRVSSIWNGKWGGGIDCIVDMQLKYDVSTVSDLDYLHPLGLYSGLTLRTFLSYRNFEIHAGIRYASEYGFLVPQIGIGYTFRSKKFWDYMDVKCKERQEKIIQARTSQIYRQSGQSNSYSQQCPSHSNTGVYSESYMKQLIDKENDGIVGIYEDVVASGYKLGVIKQGGTYKVVYMSGGSNSCWKFGYVKAELRTSATAGLFKATWYMSNFNPNNNCVVTFDGVKMNVILPGESDVYIKMYPVQGSSSSANTEPEEWSGTGWALENGYLITNNHVAEGARTIIVKGVAGDLYTGYMAQVVATDKVNDIAVLKITDSRFNGFGTLPYSVSSRMADVGEDVFVLGYPLTQALGNEIKLTNGIISSRTGYQGDVACYQMSAPVQPGNSGGPMFDSKGNVIGIVVAGVPGAENVGYAIKTSYLKILIESAGLNITFPSNKTISTLSLAEKVKRVKNFVYYIECSK